MKAIKWPKITVFCALLLCLSTSGCSSNNEPDNPNEKEFIRACYNVQLAQSWYDLYDIIVTYTDISGETKTLTITSDYIYDKYVSTTNAPKSYTLNVTAKPKDQTPEIKENFNYNLDKNCSVNIYRFKENAYQMETLHTVGNTVSLSTEGNALQAQLDKEHIIFHTTYTITE